jgi:hypothetical protein
MARQKRPQRIPQDTLCAKLRPRNPSSFRIARTVTAAVAKHVLAPVVDAQANAREDVCEDGGGEEERLERERLIVGSCEEEVGLRGGDGAGEERDETGVGVVEDEVEGWGDGGVFLEGLQDMWHGPVGGGEA